MKWRSAPCRNLWIMWNSMGFIRFIEKVAAVLKLDQLSIDGASIRFLWNSMHLYYFVAKLSTETFLHEKASLEVFKQWHLFIRYSPNISMWFVLNFKSPVQVCVSVHVNPSRQTVIAVVCNMQMKKKSICIPLTVDVSIMV